MEIEFTTITRNKPKLLEKMFKSLINNLIGVDYKNSTLYISVLPIPYSTNMNKIKEVADNYFGNVYIHYSTKITDIKSVIWCFSNVKKDIFFNIDSNWKLNTKINISDILKYCSKYRNWHQCIFYRTRFGKAEPTLFPALHKTKYTKIYLKFMNDYEDPQLQFREIHNNDIKGLKYIIFPNNIVEDSELKINYKVKENIFNIILSILTSVDTLK